MAHPIDRPGPRPRATLTLWVRALTALVAVAFTASACVTAVQDDGAGTPIPSPLSSPLTPVAPATTGAPDPSPPAPSPGLTATPSVAPTEAAPSVPPRSAEPSIGYISLDESQAFVRSVSAGIREAAAAADIALVECDSGWTRSGVRDCAEQLARAGVHGVISFQPFADLVDEVCETTGDAPTIGIVYEQGPCQVSLLEVDQAESGRLAGDAMGALAAERWGCDVRAYLSLESGADDPIGGARMLGFRDGYEAHCELPGTTRTLSGAQHSVTAQTQVAEQLERIKGKPIMVAGVSDIAVLGAMEAATEAGREKHVWYGGQLAEPAIREEIACNERYIASVAHLPERFGNTLVPALIETIEGGEVPSQIDAELQLVTAANVRELFPDTPACGE